MIGKVAVAFLIIGIKACSIEEEFIKVLVKVLASRRALVVPALVNDRHEPSPINTTFSL
jgi:hypothetical protein